MQAVVSRAGFLDNRVDHRSIGELWRRTGGVGQQLGGDATSDLGPIGQQQATETGEVVERAAVGEFGTRIDGWANADETGAAALIRNDLHSLIGRTEFRTIAIAKSADDVELFEGTAGGIEFRVAKRRRRRRRGAARAVRESW